MELSNTNMHPDTFQGKVTATCSSSTHSMVKKVRQSIQLLEGLGVEGDAHLGKTVKHRSRVAKDPSRPNLRQVHLIHSELHSELASEGFDIVPGQMGENITTMGIELLDLPENTILHIGPETRVKITGLRNPCSQLDGIRKGLMKAVLDTDKNGNLIRKAGVMGVVLTGGTVSTGDTIRIELPELPHHPLVPV